MEATARVVSVLSGDMTVGGKAAKVDISVGSSPTGACVGLRPAVIQGPRGKDGLSAYEIAVKHGYEGTEAEFAYALMNAVTVPVGDAYYSPVTGEIITETEE